MKSPRTKSDSCSFWSITERSATAGVKFSTMTLRAIGIVTFGTIFSIPKACLSDPATCLNLGTSVSAKLSNRTKKAISKVAMSANVAIQAGAPPLQGGHSVSGGFSEDDLFSITPSSTRASSPALTSKDSSPSDSDLFRVSSTS